MKSLAPSRGFSRPAPDYIDTAFLVADAVQVFNVPSGAKFVLFASTADFYAQPGAAGGVPDSSVTDGTSSELNPGHWSLQGVTQIAVCGPTSGTVVTLTYYA